MCCGSAGKLNEKNGWDIKIHIDGASGAFVVPFLYPDLKWDFRLKNVVSLNASGHKCALLRITCVQQPQSSDLPPVSVQHCKQRTGVCTATFFTKGRGNPHTVYAALHQHSRAWPCMMQQECGAGMA